jgi:hypothetical protein
LSPTWYVNVSRCVLLTNMTWATELTRWFALKSSAKVGKGH